MVHAAGSAAEGVVVGATVLANTKLVAGLGRSCELLSDQVLVPVARRVSHGEGGGAGVLEVEHGAPIPFVREMPMAAVALFFPRAKPVILAVFHATIPPGFAGPTVW